MNSQQRLRFGPFQRNRREIQPQRGVPSPGSFVSVFDALRRAKEGKMRASWWSLQGIFFGRQKKDKKGPNISNIQESYHHPAYPTPPCP